MSSTDGKLCRKRSEKVKLQLRCFSKTLNWIIKWCSYSSHTVHLFVLHVHIQLTAVTSSESCCKPHKFFQITLMGRTSLRRTFRQTIRIPGNPNSVILSPQCSVSKTRVSWRPNKDDTEVITIEYHTVTVIVTIICHNDTENKRETWCKLEL